MQEPTPTGPILGAWIGNNVRESGASIRLGTCDEEDVEVRRGQAKDKVRSRSRTLVVCGLEGTRRLIQVETAILRL